jgi:hypothetical protein
MLHAATASSCRDSRNARVAALTGAPPPHLASAAATAAAVAARVTPAHLAQVSNLLHQSVELLLDLIKLIAGCTVQGTIEITQGFEGAGCKHQP